MTLRERTRRCLLSVFGPASRPRLTTILSATPLEDRLTPVTANLANGVLSIDFTASEAITFQTTATEAVLTGGTLPVTGAKFSLTDINRVVLTDSANLSGQQITFTGKTLTLANGLSSTGVDSVLVNAPIETSGTARVDIAAPMLISVRANVTAGTGGLRLVAEGQGFASKALIATSVSIDSGAVVSAAGNGAVFVQGTAIGTPVAVGQSDLTSTLTTAVVVSNGATISSSGGPVTVRGIAEVPSSMSSNDKLRGLIVGSNGKIISAGNGSISAAGTVTTRTSFADQDGIRIESQGSIRALGPGRVELNGIAGAGSGVSVSSGVIESAGGDISVIGVGRFSEAFENNNGIDLFSTNLTNTGGGSISLLAQSGDGKNLNVGISITNGKLSTVDGEIRMTGVSRATFPGDKNHGVLLSRVEIETTGSGKVNITGQGGSQLATGPIDGFGTDGFIGVSENNAKGASVGIGQEGTITTKTGEITLTGTGGQGIANNVGVVLRGLLASDSGGISVNGSGGGQPGQVDNFGVRIEHSRTDRLVLQTVSGGITISAKATEGSVGTSFNTGSILTDSGKITFRTDSYENINFNSSAVEAKSGTVAIGPLTAGTKVAIGGDDILSGSQLTLGISDDELEELIRLNVRPGEPGEILDSFNILTANLEFGSDTAGDVTHVSEKLNNLLIRATGKSVTYRTAGEVKFAAPAVAQSVIFDSRFGLPVVYKVIGGIDVSHGILRVQLAGYQPGSQIVLFENDGTEPSLGSYSNSVASGVYRLSYTGGDGNDIVITIPEIGAPPLPPGPIVNPNGTRNIAPSIAEFFNATIPINSSHEFVIEVTDVETLPQDLVVTASSSLTSLVPLSSIVITPISGRPNQRLVRITPTPALIGSVSITLTVTDGAGASASSVLSLVVDGGITSPPILPPTLPPVVPPVTSPETPPGVPPITPPVVNRGTSTFSASVRQGDSTVNVYNPDGSLRLTFAPFGTVTGGVRSATGDFNADGVMDVVVGTGIGVASRVSVFDGATRQELYTFAPFESIFEGGVFVATGDLNQDGYTDLIVTPDVGGGPRVRIVRFDASGGTPTVDFFGIDDPDFRGGARATMADVNGDGISELIVVAGTGGGPRVAVYNGSELTANGGPKLVPDFFVFEETLRNGVYVSAGDIDGDGRSDLVFGAGLGGGPRVFVVNGSKFLANGVANLVPIADFFAGNPNDRDGVQVVVKDLDGDPFADIVTSSDPQLNTFSGVLAMASSQPATTLAFPAFPELSGSLFVG